MSNAGQSSPIAAYNSLGCNYAKLEKFHLAAFYFEKALREYQKNNTTTADERSVQSTKPFDANHQRLYWSTLHNYGLALLQSGSAESAFECFLNLVKKYPKNARLWLRLAECCIIARQKNNVAEFNGDELRHECVREVIGIGPHRKIVLASSFSNRKRLPLEHGAMPELTYEFAYYCLRNALLVLPQLSQEHLRSLIESQKYSSSSSEKEMAGVFPLAPHCPVNLKEIYRLRCSILCATSYVCLCISEYALASEAANTLLDMQHASPLHRLLANFYASESLIYLDRLQEASNQLSLDPITDLAVSEFTLAGRGLPPSDWCPKDAKSATLALLYNVGVVCNLLGESVKATEITKLVRSRTPNGGDRPMLADALTFYELVQQGQVEDAKAVLFRFYPLLEIGEKQAIS